MLHKWLSRSVSSSPMFVTIVKWGIYRTWGALVPVLGAKYPPPLPPHLLKPQNLLFCETWEICLKSFELHWFHLDLFQFVLAIIAYVCFGINPQGRVLCLALDLVLGFPLFGLLQQVDSCRKWARMFCKFLRLTENCNKSFSCGLHLQ